MLLANKTEYSVQGTDYNISVVMAVEIIRATLDDAIDNIVYMLDVEITMSLVSNPAHFLVLFFLDQAGPRLSRDAIIEMSSRKAAHATPHAE